MFDAIRVLQDMPVDGDAILWGTKLYSNFSTAKACGLLATDW
jgi:hypothetical protein